MVQQRQSMRADEVAILARCAMECARANDGRGRRWAKERAVRAMVQQGTDPALAARCVDAMREVARVVADGPRTGENTSR